MSRGAARSPLCGTIAIRWPIPATIASFRPRATASAHVVRPVVQIAADGRLGVAELRERRAQAVLGEAQPAPNTDGRRCLEGFADYDEDAANGCEAAPDGLADGTPLTDRVEGTIVPADDVDTFTVEVRDERQLLCDGELRITLTAPTGVTMRLEVLEDGEVLGQATSADGVPASVVLREPECLFDDGTTLQARVSAIGSDRSADPYLLERRGSF